MVEITDEDLSLSKIAANNLLKPTLESIFYSTNGSINSQISKNILNIISTYGAIFTKLGDFDDGFNLPFAVRGRLASEYLTQKKIQGNLNLDFSTDKNFLLSSIKPLRKISWSNPILEVENHFAKLNYALDDLILKSDFDVPDLSVGNKLVSIKTLKKNKSNSKLLSLEKYYFDLVNRSDIIDTSSLLDELELNADLFLHYSLRDKQKVFDFNKFVLLDGIPGTGKTLRAKYLLSYAKQKAKQNKLPLEIVQMNFEDRWQNGPLENIKFQFQTISSGESLYLVFVDELDLKFPSRGIGSGSQDQVLGEFLKFRGGVYADKGNYLFLATTNNFKAIDPALRSVFKKYSINSANSLDEKLDMLKLQLNNFPTNNISWDLIKPKLLSEKITGRSIYKIGLDVKSKYSSLVREIPYNLTSNEKKNLFKQLVKKDSLSTDYLISVIEKGVNF